MAAVALTVATVGAPAATAQDSGPPAVGSPPEEVSGSTYVGVTSNADVFVAVVIDEAGQARAYLCDDSGMSAWLVGTADGSVLRLSSSGGVTVEATLGTSGVTGTARLGSGDSVTFVAEPADGVAGLYTSTVSADRRVRGTSSTGSTLDAVIAGHTLTGPDGRPAYPLVGFLTPIDGEPVDFAVTLSGPHQPGATRSIVLNDGQQRGRSLRPGRVWVTDPAIVDGSSNT
jgi:hypothetical protein